MLQYFSSLLLMNVARDMVQMLQREFFLEFGFKGVSDF